MKFGNLKTFWSRSLIPNWSYLEELIEANKTLTKEQRYRLGTDYHETWHSDGYGDAWEELVGKSRWKVWRRLYLSYWEEITTESIYDLPAWDIGLALILRDELAPGTYDIFTRTWRMQVGKIHPDDIELITS